MAQCCDQTTPTNIKLLTMITITIYPQQYCNAKGFGRVVIVLEPSQLYQYMNEPIGREMHVITITYMWITQAEATYIYIAG